MNDNDHLRYMLKDLQSLGVAIFYLQAMNMVLLAVMVLMLT